jgi:methyltransferase-like protein
MKLKSNFVTHNTDGETLMISAGGSFNGMVRTNSTAGMIIEMLSTETTRDEIIAAMLEKYDVTEEVLARDVDRILTELRGIGAIDE